jgi:RNA binding exosome subunit
MDTYGDSPRRVDIGFAVGQAVSVRLREDAYRKLREALRSDRSERWHELVSEDAEIAVDLSSVVFVRLDTQEKRAGFSGV